MVAKDSLGRPGPWVQRLGRGKEIARGLVARNLPINLTYCLPIRVFRLGVQQNGKFGYVPKRCTRGAGLTAAPAAWASGLRDVERQCECEWVPKHQ